MDNKNLIELITREVLSTIKTGPSAPAPAPSCQAGQVQASCGRALIVFTGVSEMREAFYREAGTRGGLKCDILLSDGAKAVFDVNEVKSRMNCGEVYTSFSYADRTAFLQKYDVVAVPFMSLSALGHLSSLDTDSTVCNFLIWHMIGRKTLIVSAEPLLSQAGGANPAIMREINQKVSKLNEFGVNVAPLSGVFAAIEKACPQAASGAAQTVRPAAKAACSSDGSGCVSCGHCFVRRENDVAAFKNAGAARISANPGVPAASGAFDSALARMIDHTLLKPDAKEAEFEKLCQEAAKFKFASVCVNPGWIKYCKDRLRDSGVMVCTVVGFPLGATSTGAKVCETVQAIADGADEIDMVINIGALKSGNTRLVEDDISQVVRAAGGRTVKVILETSLLTDEEKVTACRLSKNARATFVKTSTGFSGGGATVNDIALMRKTVGPEMGVKASGGVRDFQTAKAMVAAGATRIGASASIAIVSGTAPDKKGY